MSNAAGYDVDFYAWTIEQAGLLRSGRLSEADIGNIAEEIESLGRSEKRELSNRLTVLLVHLLKWQVQPAFRGSSWRLTIIEQRRRLTEHLKDNLSLRGLLAKSIAMSYRFALLGAQKETGLSDSAFPSTCPWTGEQVLAEEFLPEG